MKNLKLVIMASTAAIVMIVPASAETIINTGGEQGAYYKLFCPPIPDALKKAAFPGYSCKTSAGTLANIKAVETDPEQVGIVQTDVFSQQIGKDADIKKVIIARQLPACEGLWMIVKDKSNDNYGDILAKARRLPFILPAKESGSAATFAFLQSIDPKGLGSARKITNVASTTDVINRVASGNNLEVGFFVQFADPNNDNIKSIVEKGLTTIPVIDDNIVNYQFNGDSLYQVQEFSFSKGGFFSSGEKHTTACTPASLIIANPDTMSDEGAKKDQQDMVVALQKAPDDVFLPHDNFLAKLMKATHRLGKEAVATLVSGVSAAKKAAEEAMQ